MWIAKVGILFGISKYFPEKESRKHKKKDDPRLRVILENSSPACAVQAASTSVVSVVAVVRLRPLRLLGVLRTLGTVLGIFRSLGPLRTLSLCSLGHVLGSCVPCGLEL